MSVIFKDAQYFHPLMYLVLLLIVSQFDLIGGAKPHPCNPNPCQHGSNCTNKHGRALCRCVPEYMGDRCDQRNPCHHGGINGVDNYCQNGGTCTVVAVLSREPQAKCSCPLGFNGVMCEIPSDGSACTSGPCMNGGVCTLDGSIDRYNCQCLGGFRGDRCQFIDHCASMPCANDARCVSSDGTGSEAASPDMEHDFKCLCPAGFSGKTCRTDVNECRDVPRICANGATCRNNYGGYTCDCPAEYTGLNCESRYLPCSPSPCHNGGSCVVNGSATYICLCTPGFGGINCEQNMRIESCSFCANQATCIRHDVNLLTCSCTSAWKGRYCTEDVDECTTRSPCLNSGTCENTVGGFRCNCMNGWEGPLCSINTDDCVRRPCFYGGTCVDKVGSYSCICPPGKTDSCLSNPCGSRAVCETSPVNGDHFCVCPLGFIGTDCSIDINECSGSMALSPCEHGGSCVNTPGSFRCDCVTGYTGERCESNVNECESSPCQHDGTCIDDTGKYLCVCMPGFTGIQCELPIDECASNPCRNGAICEDRIAQFYCRCPAGYTGLTCDVNIDDCASTPCRNGAVCVDGLNEYKCRCHKGYSGAHCEQNIDDCLGIDCHNGSCVDGLDTYQCRCHAGYIGEMCEQEINECDSQPCKHGGTCQDLINGFDCRCPRGANGSQCEFNVNECASNPCLNGGRCRDLLGHFQCDCKPGYAGVTCQLDVDECSSMPCQNGGICENRINSFKCICPYGYHDYLCASNINECLSSPCANQGTCIDGINSFECLCSHGYDGRQCQREINECNSNPCQHGGQCTDKLDEYVCTCPAGYSGTNCQINIDDCSPNPCRTGQCIDQVAGYKCICNLPFHGVNCSEKFDPCKGTGRMYEHCQNGAQCIPEPNFKDFTCRCLTGYTGRLCERDIDECASSNSCRNGATCDNTIGSFVCTCPLGYIGEHCESNPDDCKLESCDNGGSCIDGLNDYSCRCLPGFTGRNCEFDIDECSSSPCVNGATCVDFVDSYVCRCKSGFSGIHCQINDDDCTASSCLNDGTCIDGTDSFQCLCSARYTGTNCQHLISACDSSPCRNHATCKNLKTSDIETLPGLFSTAASRGFECHCAVGFAGPLCDTFVDWCGRNPCKNGATCSNVLSEFHCACKPGWTGDLCDVPNVTCAVAAMRKGYQVVNLCSHFGICRDLSDGTHRCECTRGYTGSYCDRDIDECASMPCLNGGTCRDLIGRFACECVPGYQGTRCEIDINECRTGHNESQCENGAACIDLVNDFRCICPRGTRGNFCEVNIDDCYEGSCLHGGTCVDGLNTFNCICPAGFEGRRCEGDVNECRTRPCNSSGALACIQLDNAFHCVCNEGWIGATCSEKVKLLCDVTVGDKGRCLNGGKCVEPITGESATLPTCSCAQGYFGEFCQFTPCDSSPCWNGGTCENNQDKEGFSCRCPVGVDGPLCQFDIVNECLSNPCKNNGFCENGLGRYWCRCPATWNGVNCDKQDRSFAGGIGYDPGPSKESEHCILNNCSALFNNSYCDAACNSSVCLFDGWDCQDRTISSECNPFYDAYCRNHYANGDCDIGCNNAQCAWDGLDCEPPTQTTPTASVLSKMADGTIIITVLVTPDVLQNSYLTFLRQLSSLLHGTVTVAIDENGKVMIYPWSGKNGESQVVDGEWVRDFGEVKEHRSKRNTDGWELMESAKSLLFRSKRASSSELSGSKMYTKLDNSKCTTQCFMDTDTAAEFIRQSQKSGWKPELPIYSVTSTRDGPLPPPHDTRSLVMIIVVAAVSVIVIASLLAAVVVVARKRNQTRHYGHTWNPPHADGFLSSSAHRIPGHNSSKTKIAGSPFGGDEQNMSGTGGEMWSDDDDSLERKRYKRDSTDSETLERSVSTIPPTQNGLLEGHERPSFLSFSPMAPTPPTDRGDDQTDINVRGPDGHTPLHTAAMNCCEEETLSCLLAEGANVNSSTDHYNETPLHLAARCGNDVAVRKLLQAGADLNAADINGRTPLHSAVAADQIVVLKILLREPGVKVNAGDRDGRTALIQAVKLDLNNIVEKLLKSRHVDQDLVDKEGKTALHWAAAVDNDVATQYLLGHSANPNIQNLNKETPLFMAALNGSFKVAQILIKNGDVNVNEMDNMDQTPRDVAFRGRHLDIVALFDTFARCKNDPACRSSPSLHSTSAAAAAQLNKKKLKELNPRYESGVAGAVGGFGNDQVRRYQLPTTQSIATTNASSTSLPVVSRATARPKPKKTNSAPSAVAAAERFKRIQPSIPVTCNDGAIFKSVETCSGVNVKSGSKMDVGSPSEVKPLLSPSSATNVLDACTELTGKDVSIGKSVSSTSANKLSPSSVDVNQNKMNHAREAREQAKTMSNSQTFVPTSCTNGPALSSASNSTDTCSTRITVPAVKVEGGRNALSPVHRLAVTQYAIQQQKTREPQSNCVWEDPPSVSCGGAASLGYNGQYANSAKRSVTDVPLRHSSSVNGQYQDHQMCVNSENGAMNYVRIDPNGIFTPVDGTVMSCYGSSPTNDFNMGRSASELSGPASVHRRNEGLNSSEQYLVGEGGNPMVGRGHILNLSRPRSGVSNGHCEQGERNSYGCYMGDHNVLSACSMSQLPSPPPPSCQYLTPPSQHSFVGGCDTPPMAYNGDYHSPVNYPTPSPESPGHWSSSSPKSAQSDWSSGSPINVQQQLQHIPYKKNDRIYN